MKFEWVPRVHSHFDNLPVDNEDDYGESTGVMRFDLMRSYIVIWILFAGVIRVGAVDSRTNEAAGHQNLVKKPSQSTDQSLLDQSEQTGDKIDDGLSKSANAVLLLYTMYPLVVAIFFIGVLRFYFRKKRHRDRDRVRIRIIDEQDDATSNVQNNAEQHGEVEVVVSQFWISSEMQVEVEGLVAYIQKSSHTANWIFEDNSRASIWAFANRTAHEELERLSNAVSEEDIRSKSEPIAGLFFATLVSHTAEAIDTSPGAPTDAPPILPPAEEQKDDAEDVTRFALQISTDNDDGPLKSVASQTLSEFNPLGSTYTLLRLSFRDNNATAATKQAMLLSKFKRISISDNMCSFKLPRLVPIWSDYGVRVCGCTPSMHT